MNQENYDLDTFNRKMNEWVTSQGLMFQMKYGSSSSFGRILFALILRFLLIVAIIVGVVVMFLNWRANRDSFRVGVEEGLGEFLGAEESSVKTFARSFSGTTIQRLSLEGGLDSFFHQLDVGTVRMSQPIQSLLPGQRWEAGQISCTEPVIVLKAGAETEEEAEAVWAKLFESSSRFGFGSIKLEEANITWGYRLATRGKLTKSTVTVTRESEDEWALTCEGGKFSQAWVEGARIVNLSAKLHRVHGISIEDAELALEGGGTVKFSAEVSVGARPLVTGSIEAEQVSVSSILPALFADQINGTISFSGSLGGAPNQMSGISTTAQSIFDAGEIVELRRSLPIVNLFQFLDRRRTFQRIQFTNGSFTLEHDAESVRMKEIDLASQNLIRVQGDLEVRKPTVLEVAELLDVDKEEVTDALLRIDTEEYDPVAEVVKLDLKEAAKAAAGEGDNAERHGLAYGAGESEILLRESIKSALQNRRLRGDLLVVLNRNGLSNAPYLIKEFERDEETLEIFIPFVVNDALQDATRSMTGFLQKKLEEARQLDGSALDEELERALDKVE